MSTICKLDPTVRVARRRRAQAVREFGIMSLTLRDMRDRMEARVIAKRLNVVRTASGIPGWIKDKMFKKIIARHQPGDIDFNRVVLGMNRGRVSASGAPVEAPAAGPAPKRGLWQKVKGLFGR